MQVIGMETWRGAHFVGLAFAARIRPWPRVVNCSSKGRMRSQSFFARDSAEAATGTNCPLSQKGPESLAVTKNAEKWFVKSDYRFPSFPVGNRAVPAHDRPLSPSNRPRGC
jgi:hypothetical protein